jgi:transcriptional regulator with XRE-family HTH domain
MAVTSQSTAINATASPAFSPRELDFQVVRGSSGLIATFEAFRESQGTSKAEIARRADLYREAVSRLLTAENPNPTLKSIIQLLAGLDLHMEITIRPTRQDDSPYLVEVGGKFGRERKVAGEDF